MDDRSFFLALGVIALSGGALLLDALFPVFAIPGPFWGVPVGMLTYLTTVGSRRKRTDDDVDGGER